MTKQQAHDLIVQVCHDYRRALPGKVQLYQSKNRRSSSGRWCPNINWRHGKRVSRLHVTLGTSGNDHREVVLHELAHHLVGRTAKGRRVGHPVRFWKLHYELCERYGVSPDYKRNIRYRAKAAVGLPQSAVGDGLDSLRELLVIG